MFRNIFPVYALLAVVLSAAVPEEPVKQPVPIISQESDIEPDGSFKWSFEAGDGTKLEQSGAQKQVENGTAQAIQGSVTWVDPAGAQHTLNYTADENGFQPQGSDIPVSPNLPVATAN